MSDLHVLRPGMFTTVQDLGRWGWQQYGIVVGGAMDLAGARLANMLAGNEPGAALLECTLSGPTIRFERDTLIAIGGGDFTPMLDGVPLPLWRPVLVRSGSTLQMGVARTGCRCYLAVAGGIDVAPVLGSRSTYLRAVIGGVEGRMLRAGDRLPAGASGPLAQAISERLGIPDQEPFRAAPWRVSPELLPPYTERPVLGVLPGRHRGLFAEEALERFWQTDYTVSSQSDRMGYRLQGAPLQLAHKQDLLSEAVPMGTIQVPPDGQPIILMADRQTTGGYPVIGYVTTADLPVLAQVKPGARICFRPVTLAVAEQRRMDAEKHLNELQRGITLWAGQGGGV